MYSIELGSQILMPKGTIEKSGQVARQLKKQC